METYQAPAPGQVDVKVDPESSRLQILEPFKAWDGKDVEARSLFLCVNVTGPMEICHQIPRVSSNRTCNGAESITSCNKLIECPDCNGTLFLRPYSAQLPALLSSLLPHAMSHPLLIVKWSFLVCSFTR